MGTLNVNAISAAFDVGHAGLTRCANLLMKNSQGRTATRIRHGGKTLI